MSQKRICIIEDDDNLSEALTDTLSLHGYDVSSFSDGRKAIEEIRKEYFSMVISDVNMDAMNGMSVLKEIKKSHLSLPVLMMTAYAKIDEAIDAVQHGACDYLVKPFEPNVLIKKVMQFAQNTPWNEDSDEPIQVDDLSKKLFLIAKKLAQTDASVLISGESGTGKEVLARYIHNNSRRKNKPFVAINCAAIPESMLEATLFGYEKGAFTGAYQACAGKFEQANNGTLLLDEISEMDLGLQAKLLRVIQEREVERLGGKKTISLNVRFISTTNRELLDEVKDKKFREDLFYRLNVFPMYCLPLRKRTDDIIPITEYLICKYAKKNEMNCPVLKDDAKKYLIDYNWPGNVRELDNKVQRALILSQGSYLSVNDFTAESYQTEQVSQKCYQENNEICKDLKSVEWNMIIKELKLNSGDKKKVAENLGITPRTLRYKLKKMKEEGVEIPD